MENKPEQNVSRRKIRSKGLLWFGKLFAVLAFAAFLIILIFGARTDPFDEMTKGIITRAIVGFFILIIVLFLAAIELRRGPGTSFMASMKNDEPEETLESVDEIIESYENNSTIIDDGPFGAELEEKVIEALEKPVSRGFCPNCKKIVDMKSGTCLECFESIVKDN
ncbi:MAG: phage holin family protein [Actinobacteria bacterium]|nr:phage holin family protein [Actinomycetota bacterium]